MAEATGKESEMLGTSKLTYGLIIALIGALAGVALQTVRLANEKQSHAEAVAGNEKEWSIQYKTAADAAKDSLVIYVNQTEELQKEADNAKKQRDKANADAVNNARIGKLLREKLALASGCTAPPENTTTASRSKTTSQAADLFDYVQRRLDEAADGIAEYADAAGIAGTACERSYERVR